MNRLFPALIVIALTFAAPSTVKAQLVVTDPSNIAVNVEQVLQHLQLLRRVDAQIRNQLLMLQNWEFTRLDQILAESERLAEIMEDAVVYRIDEPRNRLDGLYPIDPTRIQDFGVSDPSAARAVWAQQQRDAIVQARAIQNRASAAIPQSTERIEQYLKRSSASPGPTAAVQAGNELLGTLTGQVQTLAALEITAAREVLEREAARQAEQARTRFRRDSLMRDWPENFGGSR